ncbi:DUF7620 family protein [Nonomuraea rubra]|uniref:Uncharacterized protein n=1 Tax=Nonomuraea rubra TaxID=46180 RepID=A0A7X0P6T5_9ACTN|nr:hypothetical protein [Nonomuraea rubra]
MTPEEEIRRAEREAAESKLRAQQDLRQARERAGRARSIAQRLRELREANGFSALLDDAFGGGHA